jgi:L-amino acid N-acyltransferase YncA
MATESPFVTRLCSPRDVNIAPVATAEQRPHLNIRPARGDDAPALREIFNDAVEDGLATFDNRLRSIEDQKALIAMAEQDSRRPLFVAELRNLVCGLVSIEPNEERVHRGEIGEVTLFVRRSFRSYGIGRQLMRAAQSEAAGLGYRKLIGRVLSDNEESLRLCKITGWRVVGSHEQHARHGDRMRDVTVVEYILPTVPGIE